MNYYTILTALTVSIDSFACGVSLALGKNNKILIVTLVTLTVFCMCLATNYATLFFNQIFNEKITNLGGIILIVIGIINLLNRDKDLSNKNSFGQIIAVGFAVGLDGAFANLSLALMGLNSFLVPATIATCHGLMISLSLIISKTKIASKITKISIIAPIILIFLGLYKLIYFFI